MNAKELKSLKERSINKHNEIRAAMIKIEKDYIAENSTMKEGDEFVLSEKKVRNKVVKSFGYVKEVAVDYQLGEDPVIRIVIYTKNDGVDKYVKTIYL